MDTVITGTKALNSGYMRGTHRLYEEFEIFLANILLTAIPLRDCGSASYLSRFNEIHNILNGLAEQYNVQKPEETITLPRLTDGEWGQVRAFGSVSFALDYIPFFWRDFGVGSNPSVPNAYALRRLQRLFEDL